MKNVLILYLFAIIIQLYKANAQEIVISEYYDITGTVYGEWTELLVIEDMLSIVGYKLRDNSGSEGWIGGVIFNDHRLWRNLRSGTIIVIHHRYHDQIEIDTDKSDGYIEINASNTEYFTQYMEGVLPMSLWSIRALNINNQHDIVQILNKDREHVHALGHMLPTNVNQQFNPIQSQNKIAHNGTSSNSSISVAPGRSLSEYNIGYDENNEYTNINTDKISKGIPNYSEHHQYANNLFWRQLRQPDWTDVQDFSGPFEVNSFDNKTAIYLNWQPASTTDNDPNQGYLLLRIDGTNLSDFGTPLDGLIYEKGVQIGNSIVIDNISDLTNSFFIDNYELECGKTYTYRLILYRFEHSNLERHKNEYDLTSPEFARGRQYNEEEHITSDAIEIEIPLLLMLSQTNYDGIYCKGDTVRFKATIASDENENFYFKWYINNELVSEGQDTLNTKDFDTTNDFNIKVVAISKALCIVESDEFKIKFVDIPIVKLFLEGSSIEIKNSDTVYMCPNIPLKMYAEVEFADDLTWVDMSNTNKISFTDKATIILPSTYYFSAGNQIACGEIVVFTVKYYEYNFDIQPQNLEFFTVEENQKLSKSIKISNNAYEVVELTISLVNNLPEFSYKPKLDKYIVHSHSNTDIDISFQAKEIGIYRDTLLIEQKCETIKIPLEAELQEQNNTFLVINKDTFDFGIQPYCFSPIDTLVLSGIGDGQIDIHSIEILNPNQSVFKILTSDIEFDYDITAQGELKIPILIIYLNQLGSFTNRIFIRYSIDGERVEDYVVLLNVQIVEPRLELEFTKIDFPAIPLCQKYIDTLITLKNIGLIDITIDNDILNGVLIFVNPSEPFVLKPGEEIRATLRFIPRKIDDFVDTRLVYIPCTQSILIQVTGSASDINVEFSKHFINFGTIPVCPDVAHYENNFIISVEGPAVTVSELIIPQNNFTVSLTEGEVISDFKNITVRFLNGPEGLFRDSIIITLAPCNQKYVVRFYGERRNPDFVLSRDTLDFGEIDLDQTVTEQLIFTNNSAFTNYLKRIQEPNSPFYYSGNELTNSDINEIILQNEQYIFDFSFRPTQFGIFEEIIEIKFDTPCQFTHQLVLIGKAWQPTSGVVKLSVPDLTLIRLNEIFTIPISISGAQGLVLSKSGIKSMEFTLNYNPTMLFPFEITGNPESGINLNNLSANEIEPGKYLIKFVLDDYSQLKDSELLNIKALSLLGNAIESKLDFADTDISFIFPSITDINLETENGRIRLSDDCLLENRLINMTGNVSLKIKNDLPLKDNILNLIIETVTEENTKINIYDMNGNIVKEVLNKSLKPGFTIIDTDISNLSSSVYFIVMHSGISVLTEKIILLKN